MSAHEGISRLYWLANRVALVGSLGGTILWVTMFYLRGNAGFVELLVFILIPMLLAVLIRALAWVLAGFLLPPR
jgi:hypothetical protein